MVLRLFDDDDGQTLFMWLLILFGLCQKCLKSQKYSNLVGVSEQLYLSDSMDCIYISIGGNC